MRHVLDTLKKEHPDITKAYFRQDNAGCYHSSSTIMACRDLATHTGIHVVRIDFSDPQGGKGAADRLAATCKSHIRTYINEGHDVCTAADMKDALLSNGGLKGVRVAAIDTILETPDTSCTIKGITKLNNFEFSATDAITCWRAYGVGQGTTIQTDKLPYARQRDPDEMDIQAANEEANFACARSMVESSEPQHPIVYDQYDLCAMGDAELKSFKLPTLQR
ncbi:hypothetical protein QZH41_009412, partial [Actinostola sp. cb2023]